MKEELQKSQGHLPRGNLWKFSTYRTSGEHILSLEDVEQNYGSERVWNRSFGYRSLWTNRSQIETCIDLMPIGDMRERFPSKVFLSIEDF